MSAYRNYNQSGIKAWLITLTVIIAVFILGATWLGLIWGKEAIDDTKQAIDNIKQEQTQTPETEDETNAEETAAYVTTGVNGEMLATNLI